MNSTNSFTFEDGHITCLNDQALCPYGFTFMFWMRTLAKQAESLSAYVVFASGDCVGQHTHGDGFCFLIHGNYMYLYHAYGGMVKEYNYTNFVTVDTWAHITISYSSLEKVMLFNSGKLQNSLQVNSLNRDNYVKQFSHHYKGVYFASDVYGLLAQALDLDSIYLFGRMLKMNEITGIIGK